MTSPENDTAEFVLPEILASGFFKVNYEPTRLEFGAVTHTGLRRAENQDNYAVIRRRRSRDILASSVELDETAGREDSAYMLMVADGLGGKAFGDLASRLVLQTAWNLAQRAASWLMKLKDFDAQQVRERVQAYVKVLQQTLRNASENDPRLKGMGTTLTTVGVMGQDAVVSHIGDSRAYLLRGGILMPMTHDQTLAQRLIGMGCAPEDVTQFQHVMYNCLSTDLTDVEVELHHVELREGDRLLLCTDGLTGELSDDELPGELTRSTCPRETCGHLLKLALDRGGRDNVTLIVADVHHG